MYFSCESVNLNFGAWIDAHEGPHIKYVGGEGGLEGFCGGHEIF